MVCLSVILLCYRITCLWFCNKEGCYLCYTTVHSLKMSTHNYNESNNQKNSTTSLPTAKETETDWGRFQPNPQIPHDRLQVPLGIRCNAPQLSCFGTVPLKQELRLPLSIQCNSNQRVHPLSAAPPGSSMEEGGHSTAIGCVTFGKSPNRSET